MESILPTLLVVLFLVVSCGMTAVGARLVVRLGGDRLSAWWLLTTLLCLMTEVALS